MKEMRARGLWSRAARQAHDPDVVIWIARAKTHGGETGSLNVRSWQEAGLQRGRSSRPLSPRKQTVLGVARDVRF